jgi:hypothetical protein
VSGTAGKSTEGGQPFACRTEARDASSTSVARNPVAALTRVNGLGAAGGLGIALAVERFVNAVLVDGIASYVSIRFMFAVAFGAVGVALLTVSVIAARATRTPRRTKTFGSAPRRKENRTWRG